MLSLVVKDIQTFAKSVNEEFKNWKRHAGRRHALGSGFRMRSNYEVTNCDLKPPCACHHDMKHAHDATRPGTS